LANLSVDSLAGIVGLGQKVFSIRIETRHFGRFNLRQRPKPEGKTAWHTAVQTAKIAMEKPLRVYRHNQFRAAIQPLFGTERAIGGKHRTGHVGVYQVASVKRNHRLSVRITVHFSMTELE
jgi:hypothetical protein